jgi:anthraniloyl-CoA monooxygenase
VFSDATLDNFERHDPPSYQRITQEFAYWDDIAIHFKGTVHRIGGNGFCGCSRRALLLILQERARDLGVELVYQVEIEDEARFADADLIVVADGINSRFREKARGAFRARGRSSAEQVHLDGAPPSRSTPSPSSSRRPSGGPFIAHAYQYEAGARPGCSRPTPTLSRAPVSSA